MCVRVRVAEGPEERRRGWCGWKEREVMAEGWMPATSLVRWMSITSGRSFLRVVVEVWVRGVVDWRSLASGWTERSEVSMEMSESEASESEEETLDSFRRLCRDEGFFGAEGLAHSGTG